MDRHIAFSGGETKTTVHRGDAIETPIEHSCDGVASMSLHATTTMLLILASMKSGGNFAIFKASAGSGKTSLLVRVFLRLCLQHPSPSYFKRILAVTFTNKAANEMKERFLSELHGIATTPLPYPSGSNYMLDGLIEDIALDALTLRQRAESVFNLAVQDYGEIGIGTIDRFNHKLIRSFSRDLQLNSDFEVEMEVKQFFRDVIHRMLENAGDDRFLTDHVMSFIRGQLESDKRPGVREALEKLFGLVMKDEGRRPLRAIEQVDEAVFASWRKELLAARQDFERRSAAVADRVFSLLKKQGLDADDLNYKKSGWFGYFKKLLHPKDMKQKPALHSGIKNFDNWGSKKLSGERRALLDEIQPELSQAYDRATHLLDNEFNGYLQQKLIAGQIDLLALLGRLSAAAKTLREDRNILPISDFNHLISDAIRNEPVAFVYEKYGSRYNHILIDEFQDTGELQWKNMVPLIEESLSRGQLNMVVGDAKQSIYRWRGGKAEQLIRLPEFDPKDVDYDMATREIFRANGVINSLKTNYRSLPSVVEFNNAFISELGRLWLSAGSGDSSEKIGNLYAEEYAPDNVRQAVPKSKKGGYVEVRCLGKKPTPPQYCRAFIEQVHHASKAGYSYRDMAVLLRSAKHEGEEIVQALADNNIPFSTVDSFGLDQSPAVDVLISLLRLSVDRSLAPAGVRAMRNLAFLHGLPYRPHAFVREGSGGNSPNFESFARGICPEFTWSDLGELGAFDFCRHIARLLLPTPHRRGVFVDGLLNVIFGQGGSRIGPAEFLAWWDSLGRKPSAASGEHLNRIKVLTIHKAKGLQYKVCFLPHVDWKISIGADLRWFDGEDLATDTIPYAPLPTSINFLDACGLGELARREEKEQRFDNLNLIYVGATRAEERYYLNYATAESGRVGQAVDEVMEKLIRVPDALAGLIKTDEPEVPEPDEDHSEGEHSDSEAAKKMNAVFRYGSEARSTSPAARKTDRETGRLDTSDISDINLDERFTPADDSLAKYRDIGIRFHALVARSPNKQLALKALRRHEQNTAIDSSTASKLVEMIDELYDDPRFANSVKGANWLAEREVSIDGEVLRPDLVLDHPDRAVVLDFKTGVPRDEHCHQVRKYLNAVSGALRKPVQAHLIYLSPYHWMEVEEAQAD